MKKMISGILAPVGLVSVGIYVAKRNTLGDPRVKTVNLDSNSRVNSRGNSRISRRIASYETCPRNTVGGLLKDATHLYSSRGKLEVNLLYQATVDSSGNQLYCFMMSNGEESPTLHINLGDRIVVHVTNNTPASTEAENMMMRINSSTACKDKVQNDTSMNIHYHGTNSPPTCGRSRSSGRGHRGDRCRWDSKCCATNFGFARAFFNYTR